MLFNSIEYLFFFLIVCHVGWLLIDHVRLRVWVLLAASYYFYASNNGWLLLLIVASTQVDYFCGLRISRSTNRRHRKLYLLVSICSNLAVLGYFKYYDFFFESWTAVCQSVGATAEFHASSIVLPVGISFYTFQSMSYTLDVYRGEIPAERSWSRFAFYVAYFPQLIAGPIVRAADFLPQLAERPKLDQPDLERSIALIFKGLLKKIVIADGLLAMHSESAFDAPAGVDSFVAWLGLLTFTFQIYFDFSGYSDVAIGCSRLMGYHIPDNFRFPYTAASFSDFWRRWHISLSSWLRDYLYIPLGGNRMPTTIGVYRNLMVVMLLGGLWHGAAWNFVIWGGLHGSFLIIERIIQRKSTQAVTPPSILKLCIQRTIVFCGVLATWVVFRASGLAGIKLFVQALFAGGVPDSITLGQAIAAVVVSISFVMEYVGDKFRLLVGFLDWALPLRCILYGLAAIVLMIFSSSGPEAFIYFQF